MRLDELGTTRELHMTLACVEALCRQKRLDYKREDNGISFEMYGQYSKTRYPVLVSPTGRSGVMQAVLWFPEPETQKIEGVEELCKTLNKTFATHVQVGFSQPVGRFWVGTLFTEKEAEQKLSGFAFACNILFPLFLRVGSLGRWSGDLVQLACTATEECAGRA